MQLAVFSNKVFSVSPNRIYTFDGLSVSGEINTETQERESKKPATYIKGLGLESITLSIPLIKQKGVDIQKEWESWKKIRDARVPYYFILGGKPLLPNKVLLKGVDLPDAIFNQGEIIRATIQLKFEEYDATGSKSASKTNQKRSNPSYTESTLQGDELTDTAEDLF